MQKNLQVVNFLGRKVGDGYPAYIISEIGVNFKTFEEGKRLIDASIKAGADSVKIQTFKADNLTTHDAIFDLPKIGKVPQYDVFKELELPDDVQRKLFEYARKKKVVLFSTPADKYDVDFLEEQNMPIYKIGSDDATNVPLLEYIAKLRKPTIVSTGMCTMNEVVQIKEIFSSNDNEKLVILHCVTKYPTDPKFVNLKAINTMKEKLKIPIGYSDHCLGIEVCKAAISMGANVIEKHVTMNKKQSGPDHVLSATPVELEKLVEYSKLISITMGNGIKAPAECEKFTRKESRKSIVALTSIPKGIRINENMITVKRPGYGIEPKFFKKIIGKQTKVDIKRDHVIRWSDII